MWVPMLPVQLSVGHGPKTHRIEAIVDSGAADTLFHADIAKVLSIKLDKGPKGEIGGVAPGVKIDVYYHSVKLWVGTGMVPIMAGFSPNLTVAALLGRRGFFEHYIVTFDPSATPPGFDIQRVGRA
jgi:hypothetical protein